MGGSAMGPGARGWAAGSSSGAALLPSVQLQHPAGEERRERRGCWGGGRGRRERWAGRERAPLGTAHASRARRSPSPRTAGGATSVPAARPRESRPRPPPTPAAWPPRARLGLAPTVPRVSRGAPGSGDSGPELRGSLETGESSGAERLGRPDSSNFTFARSPSYFIQRSRRMVESRSMSLRDKTARLQRGPGRSGPLGGGPRKCAEKQVLLTQGSSFWSTLLY